MASGAEIHPTTTFATLTILGVASGLHYQVLLAGFAGGLVSISFVHVPYTRVSDRVWRTMWLLLVSSLTAGYAAPSLCEYFLSSAPDVSAPNLILLVAFTIGASAQVLIPGLLNLLQKRLSPRSE